MSARIPQPRLPGCGVWSSGRVRSAPRISGCCRCCRRSRRSCRRVVCSVGPLVQVDGLSGATSMALAVAAGPTRAGSWVACVGSDELGWSAAAETGVDLDRLVVVRSTPQSWATVTAALVDAFDVVAVRVGPHALGGRGAPVAGPGA